MKSKLHQRPSRIIDLIGGYLMIGIGLFWLVVALVDLMVGGVSSDPVTFLAVLLCGIGFTLGGYLAMNLYPDIKVSEEGFWVQIFTFGFHWMFVPWSDLVSMTERRDLRIFGHRLRGMMVWVRGLTFFHRLNTWFYSPFWKFTPGFIIPLDISEFDELVETIRQKLEERG